MTKPKKLWRVAKLREAEDATDAVQHESVGLLFKLYSNMPGGEEALMKNRGCTLQQAQ